MNSTSASNNPAISTGIKSLQVASFDAANAAKYSKLLVLKSGAGWYIGTFYSYEDPEEPGLIITEPGSRDTNYFPTLELATAAFDLMGRFVMPNPIGKDGILDAGEWSRYATFVLKTNCTYRYNP